MKALTPLTLLLLLLATAGAQSIEIRLIQTFKDTPLPEALEFANCLGEFEIDLEPGLETRKVSLSIDASPLEALRLIVKAAGAHLQELGENKFAIRSEGPPGEADAGADGAEAPEPDEETEPTVPKEPWYLEVEKQLDEVEVDLPDGDLPLPEWVAELEKRCGIALFLDPHAKDAGSELPFAAKMTSEDKLPAGRALSTLFLTKFVMWDIRWGGVFIAKDARLSALPKDLLPPPAKDVPEAEQKLREKLRKIVSFRLRKSTLGMAMSQLGRKGGLKIRLDASVPKEIKNARFGLSARDRRLDHALALILFPRGLAVQMDGAGLTVVLVKGD